MLESITINEVLHIFQATGMEENQVFDDLSLGLTEKLINQYSFFSEHLTPGTLSLEEFTGMVLNKNNKTWELLDEQDLTDKEKYLAARLRGEDQVTFSEEEQEYYAVLAELEEQETGTSTPGESAYGADAAAIGQQLIFNALTNTKAVHHHHGEPQD